MPGNDWSGKEIPRLHFGEIDLPAQVEKLYDLAHNLWWTWRPDARHLFLTLHPWAWHHYRNPVQLLYSMDASQWGHLLENDAFLESHSRVIRSFESYMDAGDESWFRRSYPDYRSGPIAYYSMEYGLHQSLPFYSGGLGVLAGDHCKSASDLGLPFVAVGLLYRFGYFRQTVDADGFQQHTYPNVDYARLGPRPVAKRTGGALIVKVPFPDREVAAKVWLLQVGRVPVLLLDTDIQENHPADRSITSVLYTRGREMRLAQELILGVGGARALHALGIVPAVWHMNEGHSALLQLERLRELVEGDGLDFEAAVARARSSLAFTTHTPVEAGHERFDRQLVARYFKVWEPPLRTSSERLVALGHADGGDPDQAFNLTAFALRTSAKANGVSRLNAEVANRAWQRLLAELGGMTIEGITNGVHLPTWVGVEMGDVLGEHLGPRWLERLLQPDGLEQMARIPDAEIWRAHGAQKERLSEFVRARLREQYARHGRSPDELRAIDGLFDVGVVTVGFARRFATYKRANLIFSDLHRLRGLLAHPERPLQIVLGGKAHPADRPGQELIQHIFNLCQEEPFRGRVFLLEDYDMLVAQMLVQGVDVWLNTPRRPFEASGTSGQKAAINGVINCSILDGWWPEAFDGHNGWAIDAGYHADEWKQDQEDALALYRIVEEQIVPAYYERDEQALPRRWIAMMERSIATIATRFSSHRMVRDYMERVYLPLASSVSPTVR